LPRVSRRRIKFVIGLQNRRPERLRPLTQPTISLNKFLRLRAQAKINLGLRILEKRLDGYHELRTIYQTVSLHDRLEITLPRRGNAIELKCDKSSIPSGPANLVYRTCERWREARGYSGGIQVHLSKGIPAGSGLGGASTDAAATLLGLERLTGDKLDLPLRLKLAASLGSDVPLFLVGGRVFGCGRGEEVYPLTDLPRRPCLIVFPGFSVSTADAYREASLRLTSTRQDRYTYSFGAWPQFPLTDWGPAENDFEAVVFARWPELAKLKAQLFQAGAKAASLSGSGSAVYAVFDSPLDLARASRIIPPSWQYFASHTVRRAEYFRQLFAPSGGLN
jgi:4-diphosphocytidyl-2-C-methyl-D-erythritol kinase